MDMAVDEDVKAEGGFITYHDVEWHLILCTVLTYYFREFPEGLFPRGRTRCHVPAEKGVSRQWGESPSRCRGDHFTGYSEERVFWPARTKWYVKLKLLKKLQ